MFCEIIWFVWPVQFWLYSLNNAHYCVSPKPKYDQFVAAVLIKLVFCQNLLHSVILTEKEDEQDGLRERKNDSIAGLESRDCFTSRVVWGENKGRRISFAYPACHPDLSGELHLSTAELGKYVLILQGCVYEVGGGGDWVRLMEGVCGARGWHQTPFTCLLCARGAV